MGGEKASGLSDYPNLRDIERLSFDESPTIKVIIPYIDEEGEEQLLITDNKELYYERDRLIEEYGLEFLR